VAVVRPATSSRILNARVVNTGTIPSEIAADVTFHRGATNGPVLAVVPISALAASAQYDASFEWDLSAETFTSAFELVYAMADESGAVGEADEGNNLRMVSVITTLDSDADGLLDGDEQLYGSRTDLADTDGDGLNDGDEVHTHGTSPTIADTDGDGSNDGHEIAAGTDPHSSTDVFKIVSEEGVTNYVMCVSWNAKSGTTYRVEVSADSLETWTNAPNGVGPEEQNEQTAASNAVLRYYDSLSPTTTRRSYRIRIQP